MWALKNWQQGVRNSYFTTFKDPGIDGRIILNWMVKKWDGGGMNWIDLAQDRDRWRAVATVIMNIWRMRDQLDVTCYFISLLMCSTCFGH